MNMKKRIIVDQEIQLVPYYSIMKELYYGIWIRIFANK
jgi:hypothetical protein